MKRIGVGEHTKNNMAKFSTLIYTFIAYIFSESDSFGYYLSKAIWWLYRKRH